MLDHNQQQQRLSKTNTNISNWHTWNLLSDFFDLSNFIYVFAQYFYYPKETWNVYFARSNMVKFDPAKDISDLSGKVILVTGGK